MAPTAEQILMGMGCDHPTQWMSGPALIYERYTSCPAGSTAVANWVTAHASPYTTDAWGAHFDDAACDNCIPRVPSGRDYVFYDPQQARPYCGGCPDRHW
jgi:hypothetical protein